MLDELFNGLPNSTFADGRQSQTNLSGLLGIQDENELRKALGTDASLGSDASAMIGESLDNIVKLIVQDPRTFAPKLKRIESYDAKAIQEEYNLVTSLGKTDNSWAREGQLGHEDAATYERVTEEVKHVVQYGSVTDTAERAAKHKFGSLYAKEVNLRLRKLLLDIDRDIMHGDNTLNPLAWRGLIQQVMDRVGKTSEVYTDMVSFNGTVGTAGGRETYIKGGQLSAELLRAKAEIPLVKGGVPTCVYLAPKDKRIIGAAENGAVRYYQENQNSSIAKGMRVDQINTDFGDDMNIDIVWDIHMQHRRGRPSSKPKNPADPKLFHKNVASQLPDGAFSLAATAPSGAPGKLPVDQYFYGIAPKGGPAEGKIRMLNTGVTTTNTNGTVEITLTLPADLSNISSWCLYRSTVGGNDYNDFRFVKEIPLDTSNGATQVIVDDGTIMPSSRYAFQYDESKSALAFLLYPTTMRLDRIDRTQRFYVESEMLCQLYAPQYAHVFENVGGHADTLLDTDG